MSRFSPKKIVPTLFSNCDKKNRVTEKLNIYCSLCLCCVLSRIININLLNKVMAQKFFFHEPTKKSNLMVHALGKKYFLHKRFLRESPYFAQLIHEKKSKEIRLEITDQLITLACKIFKVINVNFI